MLSWLQNFNFLKYYLSKMYQLIFLIILLISKIDAQKRDGPIIESLFTSPYLVEGRKFSLTCQINNSPEDLSFEWYLNGQKINQNDNIVINNLEDKSLLNIKKMNLEYSGDYICKISNSLGIQDSKSITIKLNGKSSL